MPEVQRHRDIPRSASWRFRRAGAAVVALAAVLGAVVGVGVGALAPVDAAAAGCGPAPQGQIAAVVVVDRGSGAAARCATVGQGSTGLDALRAAGHDVRLDGGFVCAIDGLPATGCGNRPSEGSAYWRYWHAPPGGAWSYSQVGAGGYRLPSRCAVEGWVWSDSPSSNTPPSVGAPQVLCEAPTTTTAPPTTARPASAPPSTTGSASAPSPAGTPPAAGSSSASGGAAAPGVAADSAASDPSVVAGSQGATAEVHDATTVPDAAEAPDGDGSTSSPEADVGTADDADGDRVEAAAGSPVASSGEPAPPWGLAIGVLLIAGVGGGAWWRSRRGRTENA